VTIKPVSLPGTLVRSTQTSSECEPLWLENISRAFFALYPAPSNLYPIDEVFDRFSLWDTWRLRRRWIV
jgi:hypothetical protein